MSLSQKSRTKKRNLLRQSDLVEGPQPSSMPDVQLHIGNAPLETIAVKLMEENERPETGSRPGLSDAGANGSQQERRKRRVIGRLRCGIARRLRCFGAADRRRTRGGRR